MIPSILVKLEGKDASNMLRAERGLRGTEDVQDVWANFDIDEQVMEALAL